MESTTQERPASTFVAKIVEEEQEKAKTLLSSFFDSYCHPIFQAIEVIQSIKPSIFQAIEIAQQHFKAIEQALETYRNWIKIMREAYDRLITFSNQYVGQIFSKIFGNMYRTSLFHFFWLNTISSIVQETVQNQT